MSVLGGTKGEHGSAGLPLKALLGNYMSFQICGNAFTCPAQYIPIKAIGKGAYGIVCSARNIVTGECVAIKCIKGVFENRIDSKRTIREIRLLRQLSHENIVGIREVIPPEDPTKFDDVYIVYELMDTDLHHIIKSEQQLSDEHIQYFIYQVLRGLRYLHSASIIHRDLKPSNLLVNANCDVKICDFGLARTMTSIDREQQYTEYVVTRYYRAPELLLQCNEYTTAIDVWSVGCIFAELFARRPILPGKDHIEQLKLINQMLGTPSKDELRFVKHAKAKQYMRMMPEVRNPVDWQALFPAANPEALDLLSKMLVFNPDRRVTVDQALEHPYMASLHDINDEPLCAGDVGKLSYEAQLRMADDARRLVLQECIEFHPELRPALQPAVAAFCKHLNVTPSAHSVST